MGADSSTLRARQQHFHELKASPVYIVSSRTVLVYRVYPASKTKTKGLGDGSAVKNTGCSSGELGFLAPT